MSTISTRRGFVIGALASAGVFAGARKSQAFDYTFTHDGFVGNDINLLERSMGVAMRLTNSAVLSNYTRLHRGSWNFGTSGAWQRSNNETNPVPGWRMKGNLLEYQIKGLSTWEGNIPISIAGVNAENEEWWGRANLGTIDVVSRGNGNYSVQGEFRFQLNTWKFNSPGPANAQNPETWGAVIAHEMLHNLGHHHDKGQYGNNYPINLYENCVGYGGRYRLDLPRHFAMICGGRIP